MAGTLDQDAGRSRIRWRIVPWAVAALLLALPLVAMQFTAEVTWDETDFLVMGAMLFGACGLFELGTRMTGNAAYRAGVGLAVVAAFLLIWINLAVGIIGSENNPANLMYAGVLAIGIIGIVIARFQPNGMMLALVATASAQALSALIALSFGWGSDGENWPQVIIVLNGFFTALWLASAAFFREAARSLRFGR